MRRILSLVLALVTLFALAGGRAEDTGWQNILLLGGDARDMDRYDRSDSMIILSVNRGEALVKMTSIMRDTWVSFPGRSTPGKINAATVYGGPELAVATVNEYFGTDISDYVLVNMEDWVNIIDLLGGIDLEITESERRQINSYAAGYTGAPYQGARTIDQSGPVHLNGLLAMSYCRIRYIDSDYNRVMRQQKVLLAMAEKAQDMEIGELSAIAGQVGDHIATSLDDGEMEELMMAFMVMDVDQVEQFRVPADGTFRDGMVNGVWRIDPDFEENRKLLREFIYGE